MAGKKAGEDVPGHGIAIERRRIYRVSAGRALAIVENAGDDDEEVKWEVSSLCECGRRSVWLPEVGAAVHKVTLSGLGHAWTKGVLLLRAERRAEREAARAAIEKLSVAGLTSRDRWASRHGVAWLAGRCLMCSQVGSCVCPLDCKRCSGCRCTCECYVCQLPDETDGRALTSRGRIEHPQTEEDL